MCFIFIQLVFMKNVGIQIWTEKSLLLKELKLCLEIKLLHLMSPVISMLQNIVKQLIFLFLIKKIMGKRLWILHMKMLKPLLIILLRTLMIIGHLLLQDIVKAHFTLKGSLREGLKTLRFKTDLYVLTLLVI